MRKYIDNLLVRYPILEANRDAIYKTYEIMVEGFEKGGKLLIVGNGGSASDAEHIVGELMKGFISERKIDETFKRKLIEVAPNKGIQLSKKLQGALPAIALCNHNSLNTAFLNDVDGDMCFAQQVYGYGGYGDLLLAISTSGNSDNILYAAITAKAKGMQIICLTGKGGGKLAVIGDAIIAVNAVETFKVQELHLPIYHCLCMMLEEYFFGNI